MCSIDRVRIIHPTGEISVRDYAFSQFVEMTSQFTREEMNKLYDGECLVTRVDSHFARAGSNLKYMGAV